MKRAVIIVFVFLGSSVLLQAQKSKVIAVFQLIETGKYKEAKNAIEEAIHDEKTRQWARTWYARGLLCQTAYQKGKKDNDKEKYELYPDQLSVAYASYNKARSLDKRGRLDQQLAPLYVLLANDFQKTGKNHYNNGKYKDALKALEQALQINQSSILSVRMDSNLVYNTALAAYKSEEWEKATVYLKMLNKENYSSNVPHLLSVIYLEKADTISAQRVLIEGVDRYEDNEDLVLLLVDLLYQADSAGKAIKVLDNASERSPLNYTFPYTKGLILQKSDQYKKAIVAYEKALNLAPDEIKIYTNIGTCYYNIGVEIEKNARNITNNAAFRREKERSEEAFQSAVTWLEKAYEKDPDIQYVTAKLYELYKFLGLSEKIERKID